MQDQNKYFEANKNAWNQRVPIHLTSDFYFLDEWKAGKNSIDEMIVKDMEAIVKDKTILHLQCHFGQDTISLARMGAKKVVGIDISNEAISQAKVLAKEMNVNAEFICCNVYDTTKFIQEEFDIVFTSYGTVTWLPNLSLWAEQINSALKTGGLFYMVDFHPMLNMIDWENKKIAYPYFNQGSPHYEVTTGTYAEKGADMKKEEYFWLHPLSEIISALMANGLTLKDFQEYDYGPYECFENLEKIGDRKFLFKMGDIVIPHLYKIQAIK